MLYVSVCVSGVFVSVLAPRLPEKLVRAEDANRVESRALCTRICVYICVCVCVVADRLNIYQTYSSVSSSRHWCSPYAHLGRAASNGSHTDCHASCDTDRTPQLSRAPSQ